MTEEEGVTLLKKCIAEAKRRFVANIPGYKVRQVLELYGFAFTTISSHVFTFFNFR